MIFSDCNLVFDHILEGNIDTVASPICSINIDTFIGQTNVAMD